MSRPNCVRGSVPRGIHPRCPYCQRFARFYPSTIGYISGPAGAAWICEGFPVCDSWVRCWPDSDRPQGVLANPRLRHLKAELYRRWQHLLRKKKDRSPHLDNPAIRRLAMQWLAGQLSLSIRECQFGLFDERTTIRAIECLRPYTQ